MRSQPSAPTETREFFRYKFVCPPIQMSDVLLNSFSHKQPYFVVGFECFVLVSPEFINVQDALEALQHNGIRAVVPAYDRITSLWEHVNLFKLVHPRAFTEESAAYQEARVWKGCPANFNHPTDDGHYGGMCVSLYREDVEGGERIEDPRNYRPEGPGRLHDRYLVSGADEGQHRRIIERKFRASIYVAAARPPALKATSEIYNPYSSAYFMEITRG